MDVVLYQTKYIIIIIISKTTYVVLNSGPRILRVREGNANVVVADSVQYAQHLTHVHEGVRTVVREETLAEGRCLKMQQNKCVR